MESFLFGLLSVISFAPYVVFLLIPFILWYVLRVIPRRFQEHLETWQKTALALDWTFHEEYEYWRMHGEHEGQMISVERENNSKTARGASGHVVISTTHRLPVSDAFFLAHTTSKTHADLSLTAELFTGDRTFDDAYTVRGQDPQDTEVLAMFTPTVREAIRAFEALPGQLIVDAKSIRFEPDIEPTKVDDFVHCVEVLSTLGHIIDRATIAYQSRALQDHEVAHHVEHFV